MDAFFNLEKLKGLSKKEFLHLIGVVISDYKNRKKGVLRGIKEERKKRLHLETHLLDSA